MNVWIQVRGWMDECAMLIQREWASENSQRDVVWCCQSLLFLECYLKRTPARSLQDVKQTANKKLETSNKTTLLPNCYYYYYTLIAMITYYYYHYCLGYRYFRLSLHCFGFYTLRARINRNIPNILPFLSECWRKALRTTGVIFIVEDA